MISVVFFLVIAIVVCTNICNAYNSQNFQSKIALHFNPIAKNGKSRSTLASTVEDASLLPLDSSSTFFGSVSNKLRIMYKFSRPHTIKVRLFSPLNTLDSSYDQWLFMC